MDSHSQVKMHGLHHPSPAQATNPAFRVPLHPPLINFNFDSFPPILHHHQDSHYQQHHQHQQFSQPQPPPQAPPQFPFYPPQNHPHISYPPHLPNLPPFPLISTTSPETFTPKKQLCPLCKGQKYNFTAYFHNRTHFREPPHHLLRFVEDSYFLKNTLLSLLVTYVGGWEGGGEGRKVGRKVGSEFGYERKVGYGDGNGDGIGIRTQTGFEDIMGNVEVMGNWMEIVREEGDRERERERDLQAIRKRIKAWEDGVGVLIERVVEFERRRKGVDVRGEELGEGGVGLEGLLEVKRWIREIGGKIREHVGGRKRFDLPVGGCSGLVLEFRRLWEGVWKEVLGGEEVEKDEGFEMVLE